jgi:hypothetical protein
VATKTFFVKATAVNGFGSLSETDPGASTTGTGWTPAKTASARFAPMLYGSTTASGAFTTTDYLVTTHPNPQSGDCWRSENPIVGTFANASWTFTAKFRAGTSNAQVGRVKVRLWRSVNANGSSATELTSATQTGSTTGVIATGADATSTVTWSPGATVTLTNEYLFVQCEWEITTAGGSNNSDVLWRASASTLVTADFTPTSLVTIAITEAPDTSATNVALIQVVTAAPAGAVDTLAAEAVIYNLNVAAARIGAFGEFPLGQQGATIAAGPSMVLAATEATDTAAITTKLVLSAALTATETTDTSAVAVSLVLSAALAVTESASDTIAVTAKLILNAALAATEATDTAAITGSQPLSSTLAATETTDTAAVAVSLILNAALAATEAASDTIAVSVSLILNAALAATEAHDTAAITVSLDISGVEFELIATEATDTAAIVTDLPLNVALAATETTDTAAIATNLPLNVALTATEATDTIAVTAKLILNAALAATEVTDTAAVSVSLILNATLAATEATDTAAIAVTLRLNATLAATEATDTAAIAVTLKLNAALAATEATDTCVVQVKPVLLAALAATETTDTAFINLADSGVVANISKARIGAFGQFPLGQQSPWVFALAQVVETDIAFPIHPVRISIIGLTTETDNAFSFAPSKAIPLGLAVENDSPLLFHTRKRRSVAAIAHY